MAYIKRDIEATILELSRSYSALILTGPRQVGKTTALQKIAARDRKYITLDDIEARRLAQTDPELFLSLNPVPLLIDEVQYAPELFSCIKISVDKGAAAGSFWMTGSQTFSLMRLAQESLAGRVAILRMSGLFQREIYGQADTGPFTLSLPDLQKRALSGSPTDTLGQYERIWRGSMPALISGKHSNRDVFYGSFLQSYIQRDIGDMMARKVLDNSQIPRGDGAVICTKRELSAIDRAAAIVPAWVV
ncbi:hypothetical protein AGMMS50276_27190 [Synergistales bacterium]|nr:hypothetical protein AGMMS50276_27190 [Synergistales bacterium]